MSTGNPNPEPQPPDPEKMAKLLDVELMQKRAAWSQTKARHTNLRAISFLFLFVVVLGTLFAFWYLYSPDQMSELKAARDAAQQTVTPSPAPLTGR